MTLLTDLNLHVNQISDISALSGMTLMTNLSLSHNQIDDINPLIGLTNLEKLKLHDNQISDINPLQYMTNLTLLSLEDNPGNWEAYCVYAPIILSNNPGINLSADPNPYNCDYPPAPTPEGSNIVVTPEDCTTGTSPVTLTFEKVTESGYTSLTTSDSGPAPPTGFQIGDPPTYYEITTTASYSGLIAVCITFSGITFTGPLEALLLGYYEDPYWVNCTDSVDTTNQIICGSVTSLSTFAIGEDVADYLREVKQRKVYNIING